MTAYDIIHLKNIILHARTLFDQSIWQNNNWTRSDKVWENTYPIDDKIIREKENNYLHSLIIKLWRVSPGHTLFQC